MLRRVWTVASVSENDAGPVEVDTMDSGVFFFGSEMLTRHTSRGVPCRIQDVFRYAVRVGLGLVWGVHAKSLGTRIISTNGYGGRPERLAWQTPRTGSLPSTVAGHAGQTGCVSSSMQGQYSGLWYQGMDGMRVVMLKHRPSSGHSAKGMEFDRARSTRQGKRLRHERFGNHHHCGNDGLLRRSTWR